MPISLQTLPVEMIYRILDHLSDKDLFLSATNICQRLNIVLNTYPRLQAVTLLDLNYNFFRAEGAQYLSEALQHNTTLTELDLEDNSIGDEGAWHLSQALQHNTVIFDLAHESYGTPICFLFPINT